MLVVMQVPLFLADTRQFQLDWHHQVDFYSPAIYAIIGIFMLKCTHHITNFVFPEKTNH